MRNFRQEFSDFSPVVYLDCAYQGPFPRITAERTREAIELKAQPFRLKSPEYFDLPGRVRTRIARLMGATPEEIAITTSATQGIGIVAAGLKLGAGDEVVVASSNFPSNFFTWLRLRRKGVTVNVIPSTGKEVTIDQVAAAVTPRTRVLALDWVNYSTGFRIDLAEFGAVIHAQGGMFVVDGTQGACANVLNLHDSPVDVMACGAYKWLLGPYGTGFAYLRRDLLDQLDLPVINWHSVQGAEVFDSLPVGDFQLTPGAHVFDAGETGNFINLRALDASLEFLEGVTVPVVNAHCRRLLQRLEEGLKSLGYTLSVGSLPGHQSTIVCFGGTNPQATAELHQNLEANQVAVSLRGGMIRVSPHLYNNEADIDRLLYVARPV